MKDYTMTSSDLDLCDEYENQIIINTKYTESPFNENDTTIILEQWKTSVEYAKEVSNRRLTINGLFLTGLSLLIGSILFGNGLDCFSTPQRVAINVSICIIGIILCGLWIKQLSYYSSLNSEKFIVIRELEKYLPTCVFEHEYIRFYSQGNSFSKIDKYIPMSFVVIFLIIIVVIVTPVFKELIVPI